jgi:hypothetical protein
VFILFLCSYSKFFAQGKDDENHYKGLFANHFDSLEKWSYHFQMTSIMQGHPAFNAKYSGANSLQDSAETALSLTTTLFLGRKLWKGAGLFFNPEIAGGKGMSSVLGLAGAANGETFRIGSLAPTLYVARAFFEQQIALPGAKSEYREGEENQIADKIPSSRITISIGKFSLADFFDDNAYSHDPRSEFMNWSLMSNGAWDYPANTRGYTCGAVFELITPSYAIRIASTQMPRMANAQVLDLNFTKANGNTIEFEKKLKIKNHPGSIRFLAFYNSSSAPNYYTAIANMKMGDSSLISVISGKKVGPTYGGVKYGFGISFNQELTKNIGIFARVSWNDGQTATWAFTPIDQSASGGIRINGRMIKRPEDNFGIAFVANGLSDGHRAYLNAGGYDFMLGDGKLSNYGYEQILEIFYKIKLTPWLWATADYQYIINPAYNADRGPVHVFAIRGHVEF